MKRTKFPLIACLCGSTRFLETFQSENLRLTLNGQIVLSIGCDTKSDSELWADPEVAKRIKASLDALHLRKIDLCDYVWVLNVNGYIGESTAREIAYARSIGRPVYFLQTVEDDE